MRSHERNDKRRLPSYGALTNHTSVRPPGVPAHWHTHAMMGGHLKKRGALPPLIFFGLAGNTITEKSSADGTNHSVEDGQLRDPRDSGHLARERLMVIDQGINTDTRVCKEQNCFRAEFVLPLIQDSKANADACCSRHDYQAAATVLVTMSRSPDLKRARAIGL